MNRLVPNSPRGRMSYVLKTFPDVASDTAVLGLFLMGKDADARMAMRSPDEALELFRKVAPKHHRYDFLLPWMARELHRDPGEATFESLAGAGPAIAQWSKREHVDLARVSLDDALEGIAEGVDTGDVQQGEVVYEFEDGWTAQIVSTDMAEEEGEVMQNCIGDYAERIENGHSVVYSLRDAHGNPHVDIEWVPEFEQVQQVYGKQNKPPIEKYAARAREFIREILYSNPAGMMMAAADLRELDLTGSNLMYLLFRNVDLHGINLQGANIKRSNLQGVSLHGVNFCDANLEGANLRNTNLRNADLCGANLRGADLQDADLRDASLENADLRGANFRNADLRRANLWKADLREIRERSINVGSARQRATLWSADLADAILRDANLVGAILTDANLERANLREANLASTNLLDANLKDADLYGANLKDADLYGANLKDADLSKANLQGADLSYADIRGAKMPDEWRYDVSGRP